MYIRLVSYRHRVYVIVIFFHLHLLFRPEIKLMLIFFHPSFSLFFAVVAQSLSNRPQVVRHLAAGGQTIGAGRDPSTIFAITGTERLPGNGETGYKKILNHNQRILYMKDYYPPKKGSIVKYPEYMVFIQ